MSKISVNIYGGGAAGLFLASELLRSTDFNVQLFEKGKRLGSKLLVAGKGGFNLTNKRDGGVLVTYYRPVDFLRESLLQYGSSYFRDWLQRIGVNTFVGSSNRIFPTKGIKPIEVLNAIKRTLDNKRIKINLSQEITGWSLEGVTALSENGLVLQEADYHIFCFGGASWSITGSDGHWREMFLKNEIGCSDFGPSNCGLEINWEDQFRTKHEGQPIKNIAIRYGDSYVKGEALVTHYGLEGNAIYPISSAIAIDFLKQKEVSFQIDFKPEVSEVELIEKLKKGRGNTGDILKKMNLSKVSIAMLKMSCSRLEWMDVVGLSSRIKGLDVVVRRPRPIDESISTTGGIRLDDLNEKFELIKYPGYFCIGEMCDWDTETGGYLLQACFSMAMSVANDLNERHDQNVGH